MCAICNLEICHLVASKMQIKRAIILKFLFPAVFVMPTLYGCRDIKKKGKKRLTVLNSTNFSAESLTRRKSKHECRHFKSQRQKVSLRSRQGCSCVHSW